MLTPKNLREYQWRAIRFLLAQPFAALFLDMGLGKTISVLSTIKALLHRGELARAVLVVAPLRVCYTVWRQEALKWQHTRKLTFSLVHGSARARVEALATPAHIYLINPEGLIWLLQRLQAQGVDEWPFEWLVIDESSMFKSASTRRFKSLRPVLNRFKRRTILTGTPTPNHLLELWPQMYIVDQGARLSTAFYRFRDLFFERADYMGYTYRLRPNAATRINRCVQDVVLRLDAADWLELPELLRNTVTVELPDAAREVYEELENEMFLELATGDVESFNAASLSGRCHQLANGSIYTVDRETGDRKWEPVHDAKLEAVREIVENAGGNVLVSYSFQHDLTRLRALFPRAPVMSEAKGTGIERLVEEWNAGKHEVMLVHPRSAGHGLNMQDGGHTLVFFSLTWSSEQHDQLVARLHRQGQTSSHVIVHYIVAKETVDDALMAAQQRKATNQRAFLEALRDYQNTKHQRRRAA